MRIGWLCLWVIQKVMERSCPEKRYSMDWDGAWYGATTETNDGWSAEFYIPWSQMAMPKKIGDRIINLYTIRSVAHLEEEWAWPDTPRLNASIFEPFPTHKNE